MNYRCPGCHNRTLPIGKVSVLESGAITCSACGASVEGFKVWNRIRWFLVLLLVGWLGLYGVPFALLAFDQPLSPAFAMAAVPVVAAMVLILAVPLRLKKQAI